MSFEKPAPTKQYVRGTRRPTLGDVLLNTRRFVEVSVNPLSPEERDEVWRLHESFERLVQGAEEILVRDEEILVCVPQRPS